MTPGGLRISICHGAPTTRQMYTDILGRTRKRYLCDACDRPCHSRVEPLWPAQVYKEPNPKGGDMGEAANDQKRKAVRIKRKPGLGSPNIDPEVKRRVQSAGGKAQSREDKVRGGRIGGQRSKRHRSEAATETA